MSLKRSLYALICLLFLFATTLAAQSNTTGSIRGTVVDSTHAAVSSAKITITSLATNAPISTISDATGTFASLQAQPGTYEIVVASRGFAPSKTRAVVAIGRVTQVEVVLAIAAATESVE